LLKGEEGLSLLKLGRDPEAGQLDEINHQGRVVVRIKPAPGGQSPEIVVEGPLETLNVLLGDRLHRLRVFLWVPDSQLSLVIVSPPGRRLIELNLFKVF